MIASIIITVAFLIIVVDGLHYSGGGGAAPRVN